MSTPWIVALGVVAVAAIVALTLVVERLVFKRLGLHVCPGHDKMPFVIPVPQVIPGHGGRYVPLPQGPAPTTFPPPTKKGGAAP